MSSSGSWFSGGVLGVGMVMVLAVLVAVVIARWLRRSGRTTTPQLDAPLGVKRRRRSALA
jgi:hypothetical protein